jgi:hypothetical protein
MLHGEKCWVLGMHKSNSKKLLLASSCLSVRAEQGDCHRTDFRTISYLGFVVKLGNTDRVSLKSNKSNNHFTRRPINIHASPWLDFCGCAPCAVRANAEVSFIVEERAKAQERDARHYPCLFTHPLELPDLWQETVTFSRRQQTSSNDAQHLRRAKVPPILRRKPKISQILPLPATCTHRLFNVFFPWDATLWFGQKEWTSHNVVSLCHSL